MKRVLSFDCANRSLAVCYASINEQAQAPLLEAIKFSKDDKELYLNYAKIHFIKVYDITHGDKPNAVQRAVLLKSQLRELDTLVTTEHKKLCEKELEVNMSTTNTVNTEIEDLMTVAPYEKVLIEYQMSANDKSRNVSQQLVYHYCDKAKVHLVGPTLKNKIDLSPDHSLSYGNFMAKYTSKYTANKNHSKENFKHYLTKTDTTSLLKPLKKKNHDDAADSFTQILGFVNKW